MWGGGGGDDFDHHEGKRCFTTSAEHSRATITE